MLYQLIYVSAATRLMTESDVQKILDASKRNNPASGISGLLLYHNGNFLQILEGTEEKVRATFQRVKKDPRHMGVIEVSAGEIEQRDFTDWAMGYRLLNEKEAEAFGEGFKYLLNQGEQQRVQLMSQRVQNVLQAFARATQAKVEIDS